MISLREVEDTIHSLENGAATYNNCMKLASLYIVRDELRKREGFSQYARNNSYGYHPIYTDGRQGNGRSSYGYEPSYYNNNDDLIIRKDNGMM